MSEWIEARRILFNDDEQILFADNVKRTSPMKLAGKVTAQPKAQFICFNSFRPNSTRRRDNVSRLHTWVIEFDDMPINEQRKLWASSDMPHSLRVFSGNKSIHCFIRILENIESEQWLSVANALHRVYPEADSKVLKDRARFARLPGGKRGGIEQRIETIKERVPLQALLEWIESNDVTKDKETKAQRDKGIKRQSKTSPSNSPSSSSELGNKIRAEQEAQCNAFQNIQSSDARSKILRLFEKLVCNRCKAAPGKRNELLIQMVTFLHGAVCEELALSFCSEFWKWNQTAWKDPLDQHTAEARAHWRTLQADYPSRLTDRERNLYSALQKREQIFFRICRSFAYGESRHEEEMTFDIPMQHYGSRMGLDGKQVSRMIDDFIRWGAIERIRRGTQTKQIDGNIQHGNAGVYRWLL